MSQPLRFPAAVERDPAVDDWVEDRTGELGAIARHWLEVLRGSGPDVRELLHDGAATVCVADAAFAYVAAFRSHVDVGFFRGAELPDPRGLLEGTGRLMRHVKLRPGADLDAAALHELVAAAYQDMKERHEPG